ncbi:uncharacterized protein LOC125678172 isoform X2 [Ostrea edulis]|uniref:uncharacterized protein LOC125678172 isoform X2 n=1 Tax=Ostrea edulis TaxID=37623 RepID=UPI0024AFB7EB|nr:uncharacterized protein LOC125678172 isoform X2 [Ostrea edulis]
MHNLDPGTAVLYLIPTISIFLTMTIFLSFSFWRYRMKKEKARQSQRDYLDLDFAMERPRIGALSCQTHGHHWTDLMQSFSASQIRNIIMREFNADRRKQFETLKEEYENSSGSEKNIFSLQVDPAQSGSSRKRRDGTSSKCYQESQGYLSQNQPSNSSSAQMNYSEHNATEKNRFENFYYDENFTVPNQKKKKSERKTRKKKRRKLLSFDSRREEKDDEFISQLKISNDRVNTPVSLSPVHCDKKQFIQKPLFTVDIGSISEEKRNEATCTYISEGVNPSYPLGPMDNNQCQFSNTWKTQRSYDNKDIQYEGVKIEDCQRNLPEEKSTERLFWLRTDDVAQTPL